MAAVGIVLGSSVRLGSQNRKWPLWRSERGASFRPQVLSRVRALRSDYPGLGLSEGHPSENHPVSCMAALTLCLAGVALADDLQKKSGHQAEFLRRWPPYRFASVIFVEAVFWFLEPDAPKRIGLASPPLLLATTGD